MALWWAIHPTFQIQTHKSIYAEASSSAARNCGISCGHPPWVGAYACRAMASGSAARGKCFTMKLTSEHRSGARRRSGVSAEHGRRGEGGRVGDGEARDQRVSPCIFFPPLLPLPLSLSPSLNSTCLAHLISYSPAAAREGNSTQG